MRSFFLSSIYSRLRCPEFSKFETICCWIKKKDQKEHTYCSHLTFEINQDLFLEELTVDNSSEKSVLITICKVQRKSLSQLDRTQNVHDAFKKVVSEILE